MSPVSRMTGEVIDVRRGMEQDRVMTAYALARLRRPAAFHSMAEARASYDSPAYQEIPPLRSRNIDGDVLLVEGVRPDHDSAKMAAKLRSGDAA
jgi:hypothetical protein